MDEKGGLMFIVRRGFDGLLQRWRILKDLWTHGELQLRSMI